MSEESVAEATPAEPTLDDVYNEFKVESRQQTQPVQSSTEGNEWQAPDPAEDRDGFMKALAEERQKTQQMLNDTAARLQKHEQKAEKQELEATVGQLAKEAGVEKSNLVKYYLADLYNSDSRLASVYDNRHQNPQAWEKAQKALIPKLREEFAVRTDPNLAEDQRAMKESMKTSTPKDESKDPLSEKMSKLNQQDFDQAWAQMIHGG